MTETVVHVTTLEQWKSVLDVWFKQGHSWYLGGQKYHKTYFNDGERELLLDEDNDILLPTPGRREPISYVEFMAQQKEDKEVKTYYVTKEQLDLIEKLKRDSLPFFNLVSSTTSEMQLLATRISDEMDRPLLRYLGGDETIEFKVKEPLYRLWHIDYGGDRVYMEINGFGTPDWTSEKVEAFTATLDEIKKWQTPAWEIEGVN